MKDIQRKSYLVIVLMAVILIGILIGVARSGSRLIGEEFYAPATSMTFNDGGHEVLKLSWEDCQLDITINPDYSQTEAAEKFFGFLKEYIEDTCDIIPKGSPIVEGD